MKCQTKNCQRVAKTGDVYCRKFLREQDALGVKARLAFYKDWWQKHKWKPRDSKNLEWVLQRRQEMRRSTIALTADARDTILATA